MHAVSGKLLLRFREAALIALLLAPLAILFAAVPPIAQPLQYHALADQRTILGVPNFANVMSNAAFLVVGLLGLRLCRSGRVHGALHSWTAFFVGVLLVAFGSAYYHWTPDNHTLAWDRLPMTIATMGLFCALIAEHVRLDIERRLLAPALLVGVLSVAWWRYADDDLRLYAWVQFAPFLALVYLLLMWPARYSHRGYLALGVLCYAAAKAAEFGDVAIYSATAGAISGHTVKHLLAAMATLCVYLMLRARRAVIVAPLA